MRSLERLTTTHAAGVCHDVHRHLRESGNASRLEHHRRPVASRPFPCGCDEIAIGGELEHVRSDRLAKAKPAPDRVDEQHRGAAVGRCQRKGLADRTRAEDDHPLTGFHPPPSDSANGDRDRLDERGQPRIEVSDGEDLCRRYQQLVLQRTVLMHADQRDVDACVRAADAAGEAAAAARDGPERHAQPRHELGRTALADVKDRPGGLMALDAWVQRRRVVDRAEVAQEVVEVRSAETDGLRLHEHLAGTGRAGLGHRHDLHDSPRPGHGCPHHAHRLIEHPRRRVRNNGNTSTSRRLGHAQLVLELDAEREQIPVGRSRPDQRDTHG